MNDDVLKTLFLPLETGLVALPDAARILFLNGQACGGLDNLAMDNVTIRQHFKPHADVLAARRWRTVPALDANTKFDAAFVTVPKQREEALADLANALRALKPDGLLLAAAANDAGGKRLEKDMESLGLSCTSESKHKARVVWARKPDAPEPAALQDAIDAGEPRMVLDNRFLSQPGLFGWDKVDIGSALLAQTIPAGNLSGAVADFGCGYGFLSRQILAHHPDMESLHAIDADWRAVTCCRQNLAQLPHTARQHFYWEDIASAEFTLPKLMDAIVMNPPFHEGKATVPTLGQAFIRKAAQSLHTKGTLWLVANAHLPYEQILSAHFKSVQLAATGMGFKIYEARP